MLTDHMTHSSSERLVLEESLLKWAILALYLLSLLPWHLVLFRRVLTPIRLRQDNTHRLPAAGQYEDRYSGLCKKKNNTQKIRKESAKLTKLSSELPDVVSDHE